MKPRFKNYIKIMKVCTIFYQQLFQDLILLLPITTLKIFQMTHMNQIDNQAHSVCLQPSLKDYPSQGLILH